MAVGLAIVAAAQMLLRNHAKRLAGFAGFGVIFETPVKVNLLSPILNPHPGRGAVQSAWPVASGQWFVSGG